MNQNYIPKWIQPANRIGADLLHCMTQKTKAARGPEARQTQSNTIQGGESMTPQRGSKAKKATQESVCGVVQPSNLEFWIQKAETLLQNTKNRLSERRGMHLSHWCLDSHSMQPSILITQNKVDRLLWDAFELTHWHLPHVQPPPDVWVHLPLNVNKFDRICQSCFTKAY